MAKMFGKEGISGTILTDLSKAFDCIFHDLLMAKLIAYGFDNQSLRIRVFFRIDNKEQILIMPLGVIHLVRTQNFQKN